MHVRAVAVLLPIGIVLPLAVAAAQPAVGRLVYTIDPVGSDVSAKVAFFGLASKTAHFPQLSGGITLAPATPGAIDLTVTLDARALTAPDTVTLGRLKSAKFFWVDRYPTVAFHGTRLTLSGPSTGTVEGEITARGVTRPATLAVVFASPPGAATGREAMLITGRP